MADQELKGSAAALKALRTVHDMEDALFGWAHLEEHYFESRELDTLAKRFDKEVEHSRDRRRAVLDRIFQLGGMMPGVEDDPLLALREWLTRLKEIHVACEEAYDAAEYADGDEDYVTQELLRKNQEHIEKCISKITQKLAYYEAIGPQLTLTELE